jgi:hypothetical protein
MKNSLIAAAVVVVGEWAAATAAVVVVVEWSGNVAPVAASAMMVALAGEGGIAEVLLFIV